MCLRTLMSPDRTGIIIEVCHEAGTGMCRSLNIGNSQGGEWYEVEDRKIIGGA